MRGGMPVQLNIYYMQVDVSFSKAIKVSNARGCLPSDIAKGFIQEFGYTASSVSKAKVSIVELISKELGLDDDVTISFDWIGVIKEQELEEQVYSDSDIVNSESFSNPTKKGLWYKSGRAFYK